MKRMICMVLTVCMLLGVTTIEGAAVDRQLTLGDNLLNEAGIAYSRTDAHLVNSDVALLDSIGFDEEGVTIDSRNADGAFVYSYQILDDLTAYFEVNQDAEGNTVLEIREGDKHDVLTYCNDGRMLLNGGEIILQVTVIQKDVNGNQIIQPRMSNYDRQRTPWGLDREYNRYVQTATNYSVSFPQALIDTTNSAIAGVIIAFFAKDLIMIGLTVTFMSIVVDQMLKIANKLSYRSTHASWMVTQLERENSFGGDRYYKMDGFYYADENMGTDSVHDVFYEHSWFS